MWDLPRLGIELVSLPLQGRFLTTRPPGKLQQYTLSPLLSACDILTQHREHDVTLQLPPEKEMATLSSILAWRIPWTEEPGGLHRGKLSPWGHKESDTTERLNTHTYLQPPGEAMPLPSPFFSDLILLIFNPHASSAFYSART